MMNNQKNEPILFEYLLIIIGGICFAFGLKMIDQNALVTIANKSYSGGLAFLLVGLFIMGIGLPTIEIRRKVGDKFIVLFFITSLILVFGISLTLGYLFWSSYKVMVSTPETIKYELLKDLLTIILSISGIVIAAVGYGVYRVLSEKINVDVAKEMKEARVRSLAEALCQLGFTFWKSYEASKKDLYLNHAIDLTNYAYQNYGIDLDEKRKENQELLCVIRNNLAYFLAKRCELGIAAPEDKRLALDHAEYVNEWKGKIRARTAEAIIDTYAYVHKCCKV